MWPLLHQFLDKYHNKHLVFRVAGHYKITTELQQLNDQMKNVFELLDVATPVNWDKQWEKDLRVQVAVLDATVESHLMDIQAFQSQRALVEAFLTLKFQVEQKLARSDEKPTEWMKLLMEDTLAQIKVCNIKMPLWFLPLDEVDFYSKPFASGNFGLVHRGELSSGDSVVVKFIRIDDTNLDGCSMLRIEKDMNELYYLDHPHVAKMCGGSHVGNPPYLVSEDTDEGNLASYLIRSTGRKKELWKLMHQTALGISPQEGYCSRSSEIKQCAAAVNILRNGTSCEKANALMYCTSIAAVKGYNELQMAGAIPALADLLKVEVITKKSGQPTRLDILPREKTTTTKLHETGSSHI